MIKVSKAMFLFIFALISTFSIYPLDLNLRDYIKLSENMKEYKIVLKYMIFILLFFLFNIIFIIISSIYFPKFIYLISLPLIMIPCIVIYLKYKLYNNLILIKGWI